MAVQSSLEVSNSLVEDFPQAIIGNCVIRSQLVLTSSNDVSYKEVLTCDSGNLYELSIQIAESLFGNVYKGYCLHLANSYDNFFRRGREVAIKTYPLDAILSKDRQLLEDPLKEISALQFIGCNHPNIIGQIECVKDVRFLYSIMPFCPGTELLQHINTKSFMSNNQARNMMFQIVSAIQHLHSLGIAHMDLSLENILYDPSDGSYYLIDFGMCVRQSYSIETNTFNMIPYPGKLGKRKYRSPEINNKQYVIDPQRSDIWSLGVILFMALTAVPIVTTATMNDRNYILVSQGRLIDILTAWRRHLDLQAVDLIQRMLLSNPDERISIEEILEHPWMIGNDFSH
jgi:serine/threonine protein kinase